LSLAPRNKISGGKILSSRTRPSGNRAAALLNDHQLSDPLARVKHTRLYGVLWDPDDLGDLIDRLLVVVDKVNDLTMGGRQLCQTVEQDLGLLPILQRYLGVVLRVLDGCCRIFVQFFGRPAPQCRKRLVPSNRQKPGGNLGSGLESTGLTPNV